MDPSMIIAAAGQVRSQQQGLASFIYQIIKDQHLTGAQREANAFTAEQNQKAMDFSASQAQSQMEFQREMANTQWQRGVEDMQAAGLNPALAYSQGGSVAPAGAAGSGSAGSSVDPGRGMSMSDMLQAFAFRKEMQLKDAQIANIKSETDVNEANAIGQGLENDLLKTYGAAEYDAKVRHLEAAISLMAKQGDEAAAQADLAAARAALVDTQEKGEAFANARREWEAKFIAKYKMTPEMASSLIEALGSSVGAIIDNLVPTRILRLLPKK